jgi:predicted nucleotidyltransferase
MGCARPDSDVDIAITVGFGHYVAIANKEEAELSKRLGLTVRLHQYNSPGTNIIRQFCDEFSILLFQA